MMQKLRICVVGMGRHGRGAFLALQLFARRYNAGTWGGDRQIEISFCSSSPKVRSGDWNGLLTPNLGIAFPADGIVDLTGVTIFEKPEDVVADLVWICSPTSEHRRLAEHFLALNVHVLLEKPIALNLVDSDAVLAAARMSKATLMLAHELVYFLDFNFLWNSLRLSQSPLRELRLIRQISSCDATAGADKVPLFGGPGVDLHIHDVHLILLALGMPESLLCQGFGEKDANYLANGITQYGFGEKGPHVVSEFGAIDERGLLFRHGFQSRFENGVQGHYQFNVMSDGMYAMPPMTQYLDGGRSVSLTQLPNEDVPDGLGPLVRELVEAIRTTDEDTGRAWFDAEADWRPTSPLCPLTGARALEICLLERHSWKAGCAISLADLTSIRHLL